MQNLSSFTRIFKKINFLKDHAVILNSLTSNVQFSVTK